MFLYRPFDLDSRVVRETARALETIERNAKAQSQLIEDILDVSRVITGKLRLEVQPVDLAETNGIGRQVTLALAGVSAVAFSPWVGLAVAAYFLAFYPRVVREEARFLREKFPAEYAEWAAGVIGDLVYFGLTLIAVLWYFRNDWIALIQAAISMVKNRCIDTNEQRRVHHMFSQRFFRLCQCAQNRNNDPEKCRDQSRHAGAPCQEIAREAEHNQDQSEGPCR